MKPLVIDCRVSGGRFCAKCCYNTEMPLTDRDIRRIASLGYKPEDFVVCVGGLARLRNIDGHCVFLDPATGRCKIYPYRPDGCKLYPLVYNLATGKVEVDELCPRGHSVKHLIDLYASYVKKLVKEIMNSNYCLIIRCR